MAIVVKSRINSLDERIGFISDNGNIYPYHSLHFLGKVSYVARRVYNEQGQYIGRVEFDGRVYRHRRLRRDPCIGRVSENGSLFLNRHWQPRQFVGRIENMNAFVEGAAALLFFFYPDSKVSGKV